MPPTIRSVAQVRRHHALTPVATTDGAVPIGRASPGRRPTPSGWPAPSGSPDRPAIRDRRYDLTVRVSVVLACPKVLVAVKLRT